MGTFNGLCTTLRNNDFTLIGDHKGTLFNYMTTINGPSETMKGLGLATKNYEGTFLDYEETMKGFFLVAKNYERTFMDYE